jgi:hypothetical protein
MPTIATPSIFLCLPCTNPDLPTSATVIGALLPETLVVILDKTKPAEVTLGSRLSPFVGWVWTALVVIAIVTPGRSVYGQALEPRSYVNTPVGINFLLAGYGYTQGNVAFEASSPIKDARSTSTAATSPTRGPWICGACRGNSPRCCPSPRCRAGPSSPGKNENE